MIKAQNTFIHSRESWGSWNKLRGNDMKVGNYYFLNIYENIKIIHYLFQQCIPSFHLNTEVLNILTSKGALHMVLWGFNIIYFFLI